ncbi:MAG: glycosyltransferase family 39 protein [Terracidiphilus sp.]
MPETIVAPANLSPLDYLHSQVSRRRPAPRSDAPFPARTPLRAALLLAALFAAITFVIHFAASVWGGHLGYGYFRDELYFLMCGRHLDWGYVDQPPLVALQARVAELLFGLSPTGIRVFSFLAGGVMVGLTGLLTWQLGGKRSAQVLAMTAILAAPVFLGTDSYLSMNSFEPCFWMGSLFVVLRIAEGSAGPRAWLLFGLLAGLGVQNKYGIVFFLVALLAGLLLSPQRRILWSPWCAAGVAVLLLIALPNLLWQWAHGFPTYVFLSSVAHSDKNIKLPPITFFIEQMKILLISTSPLWIGGLTWLAIGRSTRAWRFVAFTYLVFLGMMMAMHAKDYYVAPIYPILFAAGAAGLARITRTSRPTGIYAGILTLTLIFITGPIALSILPPDKYNAYTGIFNPKASQSEKFTSPLPQILSDRFGWPEMVQGFAARYNALPPVVRAHTGIFCRNYGEASAVNILGPAYGLPPAISGHQNYFYWGWNNYTGDSMLILGKDRNDYTDKFDEVVDLGPFDPTWAMDFEHLHYFWLHHRKHPYAQDWPELKYWY